MWFLQIVRSFFYVIDNTLYNFIPTVYDLLMTISRTSILTQSQIKEFADRIQMLLGVFMLFKVSFSLITYIINPDEFSDKSKGFGKLLANVVFTLIMLVLVPYAFSMAYELQAKILEDNAIGTLILGEKPENNYLNNAGQSIAYHAMIPFFSPGNINEDLSLCINMLNEDGTFNDDCSKALYDAVDSDEPDTMIENYKTGVKMSSLGLTFRLDIAKQETKDKNNFLINYMAPVSTVVAVVVLLLLITFCMDVALRSVKLAFLQLIAPIPIISFVDPKSGKDGIFKKWYQMCFSTYLSLFVRLAALYFGIYVISKVNGMYDVINGSRVSDPWVQIFVIIGILMFIKQLPKILEGFGIKLDGGGFNLNPLKKFQEQAFGVGAGKKTLGAARGLATGLAVGAVGTATGAGAARFLTGAFRGAADGLKGKKFNEIRMNQVKRNADMRQARADGSTFRGRAGAYVSSFFGAPGRLGHAEGGISDLKKKKEELTANIYKDQQRTKRLQEMSSDFSSVKEAAKNLITSNKAGAVSDAWNRMNARLEALKQNLSNATTDAERRTLSEQVINQQNNINRFINGHGLARVIDNRSSLNAGDVADLNNKLEALNNKYHQNEIIDSNTGRPADATAMTYDQLKGLDNSFSNAVASMSSNIYNTEQQISNIDHEIAVREQEKAKPQADMRAVNGTPGGPYGRGIGRGPGPGGPGPGGPGPGGHP